MMRFSLKRLLYLVIVVPIIFVTVLFETRSVREAWNAVFGD